MFNRFLIYGTIGFIMEFVWTGFGAILIGDWRLRAYSSLWMFPIYGGGIILEPLHNRIRNWPWYIRGLLWMLIIFAAEYSSGWTLRTLLGAAPWNYTNAYSINGLIRLDYAPVWFTVGLLYERVHDFLTGRREHIF